MADFVRADPQSVSVRVYFSNGNDSNGKLKTVHMSLGSLNAATYDDAKAWAIISALRGVISKDFHSTTRTGTSEFVLG